MRRQYTGAAALAVTSLMLSGCALFHSNVKGGFACGAPQGTCAPSMAIDDSAIGQIRASETGGVHPASADGDAGLLAQEAYRPAPPDKHGRHQNPPQAVVGPARPALRVVYPAWRDGAGQWHQTMTAYTPLDLPPAQAAPNLLPEASGTADKSGSLLAIAESAPGLALLEGTQNNAAATTELAPDPRADLMAQVREIQKNAPKPSIRKQIGRSLHDVPKSASGGVAKIPTDMVAATPSDGTGVGKGDAGSVAALPNGALQQSGSAAPVRAAPQDGGAFPPAGS